MPQLTKSHEIAFQLIKFLYAKSTTVSYNIKNDISAFDIRSMYTCNFSRNVIDETHVDNIVQKYL